MSTYTHQPPGSVDSAQGTLEPSISSIFPARPIWSDDGCWTRTSATASNPSTDAGGTASEQQSIATTLGSLVTDPSDTGFDVPALSNQKWDTEWQIRARTLVIEPSPRISDVSGALWPMRVTMSNESPTFSGYRSIEVDFLMHGYFFETSADKGHIWIDQNAFRDEDRLREWKELFHRCLRTTNGIPMPDVGYPGNPNSFYTWLAHKTKDIRILVTSFTTPNGNIAPLDGKYVWYGNGMPATVTFASSPRSQFADTAAASSLTSQGTVQSILTNNQTNSGMSRHAETDRVEGLPPDLQSGWKVAHDVELFTARKTVQVTLRISHALIKDFAAITVVANTDGVEVKHRRKKSDKLKRHKQITYGDGWYRKGCPHLSTIESQLERCIGSIRTNGGRQYQLEPSETSALKTHLVSKIAAFAGKRCDYVEH